MGQATNTDAKNTNCIGHNLTSLRLYHRMPPAYTAAMTPTERSMKIDLGSGELCLRHGITLRLVRAAGLRIDCLGGKVWITEAGEAADIFLAAGESYRIAGQGLALIESIGDGRVRLTMARPAVGWLTMLVRPKNTAGALVLSRTGRAASAPGFPA
jgi:hypothetical protein